MPATCSRAGCSKRPSYGVKDTRNALFCAGHAKDGMVNVCSKKCASLGCSKRPSYGVAEARKPEFCRGHANQGMINLISKKCAHQGCTKYPSHGVAGTKKREFCRVHAKQGMVDHHNKKCAHPGCTTQPSYGVAGTKKREFCSGHAKQGMIMIHKKYAYPSCSKAPSNGVAGTKKPEFIRHAKEAMVDVRKMRTCAHQGCSIPPVGVAGAKQREFCGIHAKIESMNLTKHHSRGQGSKRPRDVSAVSPIRSDPTQTLLGASSGNKNSSTLPRSSPSQRQPRGGPGRFCTSLGVIVRGTRRDHNGSANIERARAGRVSTLSPETPVADEQPLVFEESSSPPPTGSTAGDDTSDTTTATVEGFLLPSSIAIDEGSVGVGGTAIPRVDNGRSKRDGHALSLPAQRGTDPVSSGNSSGTLWRGKRARQGIDDSVVVKEPDNEAAATGDDLGSVARGKGLAQA